MFYSSFPPGVGSSWYSDYSCPITVVCVCHKVIVPGLWCCVVFGNSFCGIKQVVLGWAVTHSQSVAIISPLIIWIDFQKQGSLNWGLKELPIYTFFHSLKTNGGALFLFSRDNNFVDMGISKYTITIWYIYYNNCISVALKMIIIGWRLSFLSSNTWTLN